MGYPKKPSTHQMDDKRAKEFLDCLGNGKSIYECEEEYTEIDKMDYQYYCQECGHLREDCDCTVEVD